MSANFLVAKVSKNDITICIDGQNYTLIRASENADKVIETVKKFNSVADIDERLRIKEELKELLVPGQRIAVASSHQFEYDGKGRMYLKGTTDAIPEILAKKLLKFIEDKLPVEALVNFWKHLLLNPDGNVRQQLYGFISHNDIAITDYGYLVCTKAVQIKRKFDRETGKPIIVKEYDEDTGELISEEFTHQMNFAPYHSGPYGMTIKIGEPVKMPREKCNSNPHQTCSEGLHVGSIKYIKDFGHGENNAILEVLVSPRNVVSVPVDYNNTKMRCCEYFPIAITNGKNARVYLENDYKDFDKKQLEIELAEYAKAKAEAIKRIEDQASEISLIVSQLQ